MGRGHIRGASWGRGMQLSDFIVEAIDDILASWVVFIRRTVPIAVDLEDATLQEDPQAILAGMARAVAGDSDPGVLEALGQIASVHAANRLAQGFTLDQMAAEYRAVRSDVIRRWTAGLRDFSRCAHEEQIRFNDVLDHALAASTAHYAMRLERARDLFLGVLGHDLRTPLAVIAHSASLLRRDDTTAEQRSEAVDRIAKSAGRMDLMIEDLLGFARTRLGTQLPMKVAPADLEAIGRQVVDELTALYPQAAVVIETAGDLTGVWDRERVMQLLSNLLDNAIRHRTGNEPVTVVLRGEDDRVSISVHNVGPVIPPSEQEVIFDPLRRGINQGTTAPKGGSSARLGLGLYIARQIALAHGGDVRLISTLQAGTCFVATLARRAGAASITETATSESDAIASPGS